MEMISTDEIFVRQLPTIIRKQGWVAVFPRRRDEQVAKIVTVGQNCYQ
jgi:hypothetical protein